MQNAAGCPRCGTEMEGGVCPECGFPVNVIRIVYKENEKCRR